MEITVLKLEDVEDVVGEIIKKGGGEEEVLIDEILFKVGGTEGVKVDSLLEGKYSPRGFKFGSLAAMNWRPGVNQIFFGSAGTRNKSRLKRFKTAARRP